MTRKMANLNALLRSSIKSLSKQSGKEALTLALQTAIAQGARVLAQMTSDQNKNLPSAEKTQSGAEHSTKLPEINAPILRQGRAMRVTFFYPGEEGTYTENANVTIYQNGAVHVSSPHEETTTHLQNCEIIWKFELAAEDAVGSQLRIVKMRSGEGNRKNSDESLKSSDPAEFDDSSELDRPSENSESTPNGLGAGSSKDPDSTIH